MGIASSFQQLGHITRLTISSIPQVQVDGYILRQKHPIRMPVK